MATQLASNLRFARTASRRADIVLNRVEELIDTYNGMFEDYRRFIVLSDLFFTADYWLKYYQSNKQYEAEQAPVVTALYSEVVTLLCDAFNKCTVNVLPKHLELMFGRTLTASGGDVDIVQGFAKYAEPADTAQFRLRFKDGKIFQYPWWQGGRWSDGALIPAESRRAEAKVHGRGMGGDMPNWGNCVMSMNRDIYMAKHAIGDKDTKGVYHSFYLPNSALMFAGSMLIIGGEMIAVCPNSGHFRPTENNTIALLQALTMFAIPMEHVAVYSHTGLYDCMAPAFIARNGMWRSLERNANASLMMNEEAKWANQQHPYVKRWVAERAAIMASRAQLQQPVVQQVVQPVVIVQASSSSRADANGFYNDENNANQATGSDVVLDLDEPADYNG